MPKLFDHLVLDVLITGSTSSAYSRDEFNTTLAEADKLFIVASASQVAGSPTLTVAIEHSPDGSNWYAGTATPINNWSLSSANPRGSYTGYQPRMSRLKVSLDGMSPQARIQLYVTGRNGG